MGCVIKYKGQSIPEEQFLQYLNKQIAINQLFESDSNLANEVYEALGFNQLITPNDRIVFGHPTIGKSYLKNQGENKFISLDDDYSTEINSKVKEIADKYNVTTYQVKDGGTQKWNNEYNQMMQEMFNVAKQKAISENKTLFTSNTNLLKNNAESFDKVINLTDKEFEKRIQERGAKYDTKEWKSQINGAISKIPTDKVINTDKYLSDLFITSQQKQQSLQAYSDYLDTIFPNSKVRDILWHITESVFDKYDRNKKTRLDSDLGKNVFHLSKDKNLWKDYVGEKGISVPFLVNLKNPYIAKDYYMERLEANNDTDFQNNIKNKYDGIIELNNNQIGIFDTTDYLRLGNKQDIEGFKEFVNKSPEVKNKDILLQKIEKDINGQILASIEERELYKILNKYNYSNEGFLPSSASISYLEKDIKNANFKFKVKVRTNTHSLYTIVTVNGKPFIPRAYSNIRENTPSKEIKNKFKDLEETMKIFLTINGIDYRAVDKIMYEGEKIEARAKADILLKTVEIIEGKALIDTLPEEAAHMFIEMIGGENNPAVKYMINDVKKTDVYKQVFQEYEIIYKGNETLIAKEAIGKIIATEIVMMVAGKTSYSESWFKKIWSQILEIFGNRTNKLYSQAAEKMLKSAYERTPIISKYDVENNLGKENIVMFQKEKLGNYTVNNENETKGAMDDLFYEFDNYFPEYSYLSLKERSNFLSLVNDGNIKISCKL